MAGGAGKYQVKPKIQMKKTNKIPKFLPLLNPSYQGREGMGKTGTQEE